MDCPDWPPPLPSLPLYPPCRPPSPAPPEPKIQPKESQTQEWWTEHLRQSFTRISGNAGAKKGITYELTSRQRRDLLLVRTQTREDKLIWSVPLPEGSYPRDGLPIWERLYLDRKLPMLKCPPDALIFARQKIGKKLWKDTEGQEFILYDPHSYEVKFSYENVHDPHLTTYYQGKAIRNFLLSVGDATEDGWGLCSLKRFNQYRRYLKRVHLSLVHTEMERQEALRNEIHKLKEYKKVTEEMMLVLERKAILDEMRATIVEALKQERMNRTNRLLANIQAKDDRIRKLYKKRARHREIQRQKGLRLLAEQELKNKIAKEIQKRKKIATLRTWHDAEEKMKKTMKRIAEEKARQKAEKVRMKWQNKIENLKKMLEREDESLKLQEKVRAENVEIRKAQTERLKQKQKDCFQELQNGNLRKKALMKRQKEDQQMEKALTDIWFSVNTKSRFSPSGITGHNIHIPSTLTGVQPRTVTHPSTQRAQCSLISVIGLQPVNQPVQSGTGDSLEGRYPRKLSETTQGPDRLSIILLSRYRIQREQKIPLQVSFAIDAVLERTIKKWANTRLILILETVIAQVKENGRQELAKIKAKYKETGVDFSGIFRASDPRGKIYQQDARIKKPKNNQCKKNESAGQTSESATNDFYSQGEKSGSEVEKSQKSESEKELFPEDDNAKPSTAVIPNYVHFGPVTFHEYPIECDPKEKLKPVAGRPKTPMPSQELLCQAGFLEEKLNDILPTFVEDVMNLKEKGKFRKIFKSVAVQLFTRSISVAKVAFNPVTRVRAINKLVYLGDTDKETLVNTVCTLIMNTEDKLLSQTEEFDWLSKAVAREAIKEILNPPVLRKAPDDCVARTKIMFYAPKQRRVKKS